MSIKTLNSVLLGYDVTSFSCIPGLVDFLPVFTVDLFMLCKVGWGQSVDVHLQVSPEMFDLVQVQALAGPLQDIQ